ncbi:MAG: proline dehydrogenase family protein [Sphingobacteriales bacterium]|jgi:proline dehydrogenase|nr:proline dehydrogenase family protein [Sphingobacteriales bacterium]MBP9141972.1 proline dehydrogenase family protein [Chitinophagales bacterium]MDA0198849.1 proline dehydrogenase family protein [Bacteroidota bacterium]MBK6890222.1 proline dehydrogenase family protein [Sphingobacteriales bacterium]MBK7527251.1 proline dehydrogenase family protein [Sphingobacteriales bacterium]
MTPNTSATTEPHPLPNFEDTKIAFAHKTTNQLSWALRMFKLLNQNWLVNVGSYLAQWAINLKLPIGWAIKKTIYPLFCGGESLPEIMPSMQLLSQAKVHVLLDYGAEGKDTETDFEKTLQQIVASLDFATQHTTAVHGVSAKVTGFIRFALLEKIAANTALTPDEDAELQRAKNRLEVICSKAAACNIPIFFDAEESWIQDPLDDMVNAMMQQYNKTEAVVFNTIQLYRHDRLAYLKQCHQHSLANGYLFAVKLVRGAYMEKERLRAAQQNYPSPIQPDKAATDNDYDAALAYCIENIKSIAVCNASHNEQSSLHLCQLLNENKIQPQHNHVWFSQLYGMGDNISFNLAKSGYNVAKYLPYGKVTEVIPYLIRRARENTSVAGQMGRELHFISKEIHRRKSEKV